MCTCFASSARYAFSCHGEDFAAQVPSSWERHRGSCDLGACQQRVSCILPFQRRLRRAGSGSKHAAPWKPKHLKTAWLSCWTSFMASFMITVFIYFFHLLLFLSSHYYTPHVSLVKQPVSACPLTHVCGKCVVVQSHFFFVAQFFSVCENWCQLCGLPQPPTSLLKGQSVGSDSVAFCELGRLMIRCYWTKDGNGSFHTIFFLSVLSVSVKQHFYQPKPSSVLVPSSCFFSPEVPLPSYTFCFLKVVSFWLCVSR